MSRLSDWAGRRDWAKISAWETILFRGLCFAALIRFVGWGA